VPNQVLGFSDAKLLDQPEHGFDPVDPVDDYIRWRHHLAVEAELNTKRGGTLILVAHDHGYLPELRRARSAGLNVYLVGFLEMPKTEFLELKTLSAKLLDLEFDLKAFNRPLPNRPRESVLRAIINRTSPSRPLRRSGRGHEL